MSIARTPSRRWDIFCTVIDNFGDIGVTRRLARQLATEFGQQVCLWVDDLASFSRLAPGLNTDLASQQLGPIQVRYWQPGAELAGAFESAEVVVEAFACEAPAGYRAAMAQRQPAPLWLNLEYLSAEAWVDDCHALASPHPRLGLSQYFYFPGFSANSGGLLCEGELLAERSRWQAEPQQVDHWLTRLGVPPRRPGEWLVSVFSYESPALTALFAEWAAGERPVRLLVPEGRALAAVEALLGTRPAVGSHSVYGALAIDVLPMTDQAGYDRLLWSCDFNIVRGEDSFLRAQWAGRPFLWHIYRQEEEAHLEKLEAFLARYLSGQGSAFGTPAHELFMALNREQPQQLVQAWQQLQAGWGDWQVHAQRWPVQILADGDLATRLVQFVENRLK